MRRLLDPIPLSLLLVALVTGCAAKHKPVTAPSKSTSGEKKSDDGATAVAGASDSKAAKPPASPAKGKAPKVIELEPIRIEVVGRDKRGDPELDAFDARALLDKGNEALEEDRFDDAITIYEKLVAVFPDSRLAPAAIYNIGLAYEGKGEYDAAIRQYRTLARDRKLDRDGIDAHMRIGALLAELERWAEATAALKEVLSRGDLTHSDRIEGLARLGYVALEQKDYTTAEATLRDCIAYYKKLTTSLDTNYFIAMSRYYLAQIPHRQFLAMPIRLPDQQLQKDLEAKADLVVLAYDRYAETIQIHNAYWATAAGYQMSHIYKEFWDDLMLAPIPTQLDPKAREFYVKEVHEKFRNFLEKAMAGHGNNVELAKAYRTTTAWSKASRIRATEIAKILARESGGELVIPEKREIQGSPMTITANPSEYVPARVEL